MDARKPEACSLFLDICTAGPHNAKQRLENKQCQTIFFNYPFKNFQEQPSLFL